MTSNPSHLSPHPVSQRPRLWNRTTVKILLIALSVFVGVLLSMLTTAMDDSRSLSTSFGEPHSASALTSPPPAATRKADDVTTTAALLVTVVAHPASSPLSEEAPDDAVAAAAAPPPTLSPLLALPPRTDITRPSSLIPPDESFSFFFDPTSNRTSSSSRSSSKKLMVALPTGSDGSSLLPPPVRPPLDHVATRYQKIRCGAVVQSFCWKEGQPRYFTRKNPRATLSYFTRSGGTTVCNEAVRKTKLNMVLYATEESRVDVDRPQDLKATWSLVHAVDGGWRLPKLWNMSTFGGSSVSSLWPNFMKEEDDHEGHRLQLTDTTATDASSYLSSQPRPISVLLIPFCWETYGYHLLLCIMSTWTQLERSRLRTLSAEQWKRPLAIRVAFLKGSGLFPFLTGSSTSWWAKPPSKTPTTTSSAAKKGVEYTPYWGLWSVLAEHPSHVLPAPHAPASCFDFGIFGHRPSQDTTPVEQQRFAAALKDVVLRQAGGSSSVLPLSIRSTLPFASTSSPTPEEQERCYAALSVRVLLLQRQKRYRIENLDAVQQQIQEGMRLERVNGTQSTAVLETMEVPDQIRLVAETDILIGVHGNGLSWSMMQASGSVLIELWPSAPYNRNYEAFAQRGNLLHLESMGDQKCRARCGASYMEVREQVQGAIKHLQRVRCAKEPFDSTILYERAKELKKNAKK